MLENSSVHKDKINADFSNLYTVNCKHDTSYLGYFGELPMFRLCTGCIFNSCANKFTLLNKKPCYFANSLDFFCSKHMSSNILCVIPRRLYTMYHTLFLKHALIQHCTLVKVTMQCLIAKVWTKFLSHFKGHIGDNMHRGK